MGCVILRTFNEKYVTKRTVTILNCVLPYQNFLTLTFGDCFQNMVIKIRSKPVFSKDLTIYKILALKTFPLSQRV